MGVQKERKGGGIKRKMNKDKEREIEIETEIDREKY